MPPVTANSASARWTAVSIRPIQTQNPACGVPYVVQTGLSGPSSQIGNALGVAIIGIVFYNALGTHPRPASLPHAFTISILLLIAFTVVVAVAVQFLTKRPQKV